MNTGVPHAGYDGFSQRGFSLVELSIVLVILGLLTGGILAGQSLIRAAELRAVTTEYNRYVTATQSFRDKYFALPGDMTNATAFWGATAACPGTAGTGTQTCNGNGNGQIDGPAAASQYGEWYTFWQQLANAGLIEGSYTGIAGAANNADTTNTNVPKSKLSNGLWFVAYDISSAGALFPIALPRNNLRLGAAQAGNWPDTSIVSPAEMWNIDTKMDDGLPGLGRITSTLHSYVPHANCASSDTPASATYNLTLTSKECIFFMALGS